jgi:MFS family permease
MMASWRATTFAPFKSRIFFAIWAASLISNFGSLTQAVGASWLMISIAPSPNMVALVQALTSLPIMLLALPAGALADIWDHRVTMLIALGVNLTAAAVLAAIAYMGHVTPWTLLAFTFLLGCGVALYGPAWQSSIGEQVPREEVPAAVSLNSLASNLSQTVGPAIGGVIVATAGPAAAFLVNSVSYVALIVVLSTWRRERQKPALPPERMQMAMQAGLRYVLHSPAIRAVLVRGFLFGLLGSATWALMPLIARDLLGGGAPTYGFLFGSFGVGAVIGSLTAGIIRARLSYHVIITLASLSFGIMAVGIAFSSHVAVTAVLLLISGISWISVLSTLNITVQISSPRWVVGRALAIYQMLMFGGLAAGSWLFGELAQEGGIGMSLIVAGAAMASLAVLGFRMKLPHTANLKLDPFRSTLTPPNVTAEVVPQSGPVVVSVEYKITAEDRDAFMIGMREMRRIRKRNGAQRWTLLQDIDDLSRWTEHFVCPTWLEYLRQRQRLTLSDSEVALRVQGFHRGDNPIRVRHQLERTPTAASNLKSEVERIRERASVVDPYLPAIAMPAARDAKPETPNH